MSDAEQTTASDFVGVTVDSDVCIGSGQCEMLEEEHFLIDEDTMIAGVIGEGTLARDRALRVVETCPTGAISIVEVSADGSRPAGGEV